ncbi:MAG: hypothetical protein WD061_00620 [Candidatus Saccharimonadales bacterium]
MTKNKDTNKPEADSLYFLKILMYFLVGAIWLRVSFTTTPIPIGLVIGLIFVSHEHFQIDRKVEYAILLIAAILSLVAPVGIVLDATNI